ncbi:MarR family winged helix-turn-helix transcriptional regulator [Hansschlegelia quercus]|uniref:MarR family transcriptional regulator n=1 Tax=Hansschlegelia quercus TaxID=2528245 RepID=A0A4Q9GNY0_9HYPH|nr:MarR family winged helix-turn-helix transcriptional regulator [Hansschlegelia quercus]TBN55221.1 MarR family transcriptional regulator [Hansschlegelia quercus]
MSAAPTTVSRSALLIGGSDDAFRSLVDDLTHFATRLQQIREALARQMGVTTPQYVMLMALARRTPGSAIGTKDLAARLRVSVPFVVTETKKLEAMGFLQKQPIAADRRRIDIVLTKRGLQSVEALGSRQRTVNDILFSGVDEAKFSQLQKITKDLLEACEPALEAAEH